MQKINIKWVLILYENKFFLNIKIYKGGIFIKQKLKFNLFYDNDSEELTDLLIEAIINYLNMEEKCITI